MSLVTIGADPLLCMTVTTAAEAITKRAALRTAIFGSDAPLGIEGASNAQASALAPYLNATPTMGWYLQFNQTAGSLGSVHWKGWWAQFTGNTKLAIICAGHNAGFVGVSGDASPQLLARSLVTAGFDILLCPMPLMGENAAFTGSLPGLNLNDKHGYLYAIPQTTGNGLKYFLGPHLALLDFATADPTWGKAYSKIAVSGMSGGGWTSTMLAALDPRITHSYPVAGSVPLAYQDAGSYDAEQLNPGADYLDLYAMSVAETGRRNFLLYNGKDSCCFRRDQVYPWGAALCDRLDNFPGEFGIKIDFGADTHAIQTSHREFILADLA